MNTKEFKFFNTTKGINNDMFDNTPFTHSDVVMLLQYFNQNASGDIPNNILEGLDGSYMSIDEMTGTFTIGDGTDNRLIISGTATYHLNNWKLIISVRDKICVDTRIHYDVNVNHITFRT